MTPQSIKGKITMFFLVIFFFFASLFIFLTDRVENSTFEAAEENYINEHKSLFATIIKSHQSNLAAMIKRWMIPKNLQPIQSEEFNKSAWEGYLLGFGNTLSWSFGTENIITFDDEGHLVHYHKILPESRDFDINEESFKALISLAADEESIINGFTLSKDGTPYLNAVIPSFDEEGELANIHAFLTSFKAPLKTFSESTNNRATLYFQDRAVSSIGEKKDIDPETVHQRHVVLDLLENYNNELVLIADVDISQTIEKFIAFRYELLIEFALGLAVFLFVVSIFLKKTLNPLSRIAQSALKIASGNFNERASNKGSTEIKYVSWAINKMIDTIMERNKHVLDIYKNIKYGIFTLDEKGIIGPEFSFALTQLLETDDIAHKSILDLLFKNPNLTETFTGDQLSQINQGIITIIGSESFVFDLNSHLFPTQVKLRFSESRAKIFELSWQPILENEETEIVEKIMVIVRDVTAIRKLEAKTEKQKQQLQIIGNILSVPRKSFESFLQSTRKMVKRSMTSIDDLFKKEASDLQSKSIIESLFRDMHTIKGNARTLGFTGLSQKAHQVEDQYSRVLKEVDFTDHSKHPLLNDDLAKLENILEEYERVYREKLHGSSFKNEQASDVFEECMSIIKSNSLEKLEHPGVKKLVNRINANFGKKFSTIVEEIWHNMEKVCQELNKPLPHLSISGDSIFFPNTSVDLLVDVMNHCITNSLDHGIEEPDTRKEKGKREEGVIQIIANHQREKRVITITIADDGKGLNLKLLKQKGIASGNLADHDSDLKIANTIFSSGTSTTEKITDISGRGVGMDAVKSFLRESRGDVHIEFTGNANSDGFRPFQIVLSIPEDLAA